MCAYFKAKHSMLAGSYTRTEAEMLLLLNSNYYYLTRLSELVQSQAVIEQSPLDRVQSPLYTHRKSTTTRILEFYLNTAYVPCFPTQTHLEGGLCKPRGVPKPRERSRWPRPSGAPPGQGILGICLPSSAGAAAGRPS